MQRSIAAASAAELRSVASMITETSFLSISLSWLSTCEGGERAEFREARAGEEACEGWRRVREARERGGHVESAGPTSIVGVADEGGNQ